jgi:uncharacterized protein
LSNVPAKDEQNLPFAVVSISHDGSISTFSPELLAVHHPRFGSFGFGHVTKHALSDVARTPLFRAGSTEIRRGRLMRTQLPLFPLVRRRRAGQQAVLRNR